MHNWDGITRPPGILTVLTVMFYIFTDGAVALLARWDKIHGVQVSAPHQFRAPQTAFLTIWWP
jgi:hypothetical protein